MIYMCMTNVCMSKFIIFYKIDVLQVAPHFVQSVHALGCALSQSFRRPFVPEVLRTMYWY